jgi:hypothetical protein
VYKPFDKKLYKENNQKAINESKLLFEQFGYKLLSSKEAYKDWDFLVEKNNKTIPVEVEIKKVWTKQGEWQGYSTVDIPYRKAESKAELFIMFNSLINTLLFCRMKDIINSPVDYKDTIYTKHEPFFNVEVDKFFLMEKQENKWVHLTRGRRIPFFFH